MVELYPVQGPVNGIARNKVVQQIFPGKKGRSLLLNVVAEGVVIELHQFLGGVGPHIIVSGLMHCGVRKGERFEVAAWVSGT